MSNIHPTAYIHPDAQLGRNVKVGPFSYVHGGVIIGENTTIEGWCEIGHPFKDLNGLSIGANSIIRSHSVLYQGSTFGDNLTTGHHVTLREKITAGCSLQIGSYGDIQGDCTIGDYLNCHSNVHIGKMSTIGNFCWIFPFTVLTNDPHPPSNILMGVTLEDFSVVASHCTLLPGVTVGTRALVGAHSLVNRDIAPDMLAAGVPAKERGPASIIKLKDGSNADAYPWTTHYRSRFPSEVTQNWPTSNKA